MRLNITVNLVVILVTKMACCVVEWAIKLYSLTNSLVRTLFTQIANNEFHSLHYLLPVKRDNQLIGRLPSATVYPTFRVQTNQLKNLFILFCLSNYQWHLWYFILLCIVPLSDCYLCDCLYVAYGCRTTINVYICKHVLYIIASVKSKLWLA